MEFVAPTHWVAEVGLRDGSTLLVRPIEPADGAALQRFHQAQSAESVYSRFFAAMEELSPKDLYRFTHVDHRDRVALVAVHGEELVAVARFDRLEPGSAVAEVAFNVSDSLQGQGLGSILLEHLAAAAQERGVEQFVADVLTSNQRMVRVFQDAGYDVAQEWDDGVITVKFALGGSQPAHVRQARERRAEAASVRTLLEADAALILTIAGHEAEVTDALAARLRSSSFTGPVEILHAEDPAAARQALGTVPHTQTWVAVLSAPAEMVVEVLEPLARAGTTVVIITSGGFGPRAHEVPTHRLLSAAREVGVRLVGPRSYGAICEGSAGRLPVTVAPQLPHPGSVGVFCQSAAAGRALLRGLYQREVGVSTFVSAGHRADVSGNDLLQYWVEDPTTNTVVLGLDAFGNPRKFFRVAAHLAARKPTAVVLSSPSGQLRPPGHPVRVSAAPPQALQSLLDQAGLMVAPTVRSALDWVMLCATSPLPQGPRVRILANSGTAAMSAAEQLPGAGLRLAGEVTALRPTATGADFADACSSWAQEDTWDAALIMYGPYAFSDVARVRRAVAELVAQSGRTVVAVLDGERGVREVVLADGATAKFTVFDETVDAVWSLGQAWAFSKRRQLALEPPPAPEFVVDRPRATALLEQVELSRGLPTVLTRTELPALLDCYGIELWPSRRVASATQAQEAAAQLGYPVVVSSTDAVLTAPHVGGGVRPRLSDATQVAQAVASISAELADLGRPEPAEGAYLVQPLAPPGVLVRVGTTEDPVLGPLVSALLVDADSDDVAYAYPPLAAVDIDRLLHESGIATAVDLGSGEALAAPALRELLAKVSQLGDDHPQLAALYLDRVVVGLEGVYVLQASGRLAPPVRTDLARREHSRSPIG